jgi:hypothetical protein
MGDLHPATILSYLRANPVPGLAEPLQVTPVPSPADEQRVLLTSQSGQGTQVVLKRYERGAAERARREAEGLQLGGSVGLAPTLLRYEPASRELGGPVVVFSAPAGASLGGVSLTDEEAQGWLFLLLALHHLPADRVQVASGLSPDLATWWQRMQPAWKSCQSALSGRQTRPLLDALKQLHAVVGARVVARQTLWSRIPTRPCHGNAGPDSIASENGRLTFVEWGDFGRGDPALDVGRAAGLALLTGELSQEQYTQFIGGYLRGASDFGDTSLSDRLVVFTSVLPFGFAMVLLERMARTQASPAERARELDQVSRALRQLSDALGVKTADPRELLAPLART